MKYDVYFEKKEYKRGDYYLDNWNNLYRIIYDSDRGYALLEIGESTIASEFHEDINSLLKFTTITDMCQVFQVENTKFKG